jgi:predicted nucleic acid-binding Zn ribbon protein
MIKRKENKQTLGEIIKHVITSNTKIAEGLLKIKVIHAWKTVTGEAIAKKTLDVSFKDKVLFVKLDSPALRNELVFKQSEIINMIHQEIGVNHLIEKIILR